MYNYYVYAYLRENKTPYYIGKGIKNRAYKDHGKIPVPKDKLRIVFYQTGLLETDAHNLEVKYIKLFGRKDLGTGILLNRTDGGEGTSGFKITEETRQKLKKRIRRPCSQETKRKISEANKGRISGPLSEETKQKLREANSGRIFGPMTEENKQKIRGPRGPHKNKRKPYGPMSEEHKEKIRQGNIGKHKGVSNANFI